jgi:predicted SnoaL-like aldol condensation-catalyzing enzyme
MKKLVTAMAGLFLLASCSNHAGESDKAKKNKETMNGVIRAIEQRDLSKLDQYMAPDIIEHSSMKGELRGLEAVKADLQDALSYTSEMKTEVIREFADDEYVVSWLRFRGIVAMDVNGMKKGDSMVTTSIEVARFNNDAKAIEHWTFMDMAEVQKMMGSMMGSDTIKAPPADTTTTRIQ